jgi:hypothetical protein
MNLDEALAITVYLKDNVIAWGEPYRAAKKEAWRVVCEHAEQAVKRHEAEAHSR